MFWKPDVQSRMLQRLRVQRFDLHIHVDRYQHFHDSKRINHIAEDSVIPGV